MCLPGMTDSAAAKILDWLDADDAAAARRRRAQQYADLHLPYAPRNGCPARIEELLLIPDVPRHLLLGREFTRDYQLRFPHGGRRDCEPFRRHLSAVDGTADALQRRAEPESAGESRASR